MMEKVYFKSEHGVSTITLNRPESYNALDMETIKLLAEVVKEVKNNDDKVLIISGEGNAFCAGGDVKMMNKIDLALFDELMDALTAIATDLYMMPKIVIAAVNGSAAGLGLSIALQADYIVAQKEARFGMLFAGIGLIPDGGGHFLLSERIGTHQAKQFIWGMEQVKGEQALEMGFADFLVEGDARESAKQLTAKILASPFKAVIRTKMILHESRLEILKDMLQKKKRDSWSCTD